MSVCLSFIVPQSFPLVKCTSGLFHMGFVTLGVQYAVIRTDVLLCLLFTSGH